MSKIRKKRSYTQEFKDPVLKRLEKPTNDTIASLSNELGVPRPTIYQKFIGDLRKKKLNLHIQRCDTIFLK